MGELDRRKFLQTVAAAMIATPTEAEAKRRKPEHKAEAMERKFQFLPSPLTAEALAEQRKAAVKSLQGSIPNDSKVSYLRDYAMHLQEESQMYVPGEPELRDVIAKGGAALNTLGAHIELGEYGLFIFADVEARNRFQRLYVVNKTQANTLQFVKAYPISTSASGFGNKKDSGQTPLGSHTIESGKRGLFGEVVSGLNLHKDLFNQIEYNGEDHWFVKNFGERKYGDPNNDVAEVVTDQYLLQGSHTDVSRGIRIHGTNRSGALQPDGTWITFLGGKRRSGGCIRMSNTDVRDLGLSGYIRWPETGKHGTEVMIYATPAALGAIHSPSDEDGPPRWTPPAEKQRQAQPPAQKQRHEPTARNQRPERVTRKKREAPPRWIPPE